MKIATITRHDINNYGSVLQTFATQVMFERLGFESEIINYQRKGFSSYSDFMEHALRQSGFWNGNGFTRAAYRIIKKPSYHRQETVFSSFLHEYIRMTRHEYHSFDELKAAPPETDYFCTGSDQTWNSKYNGGIDKAYYLAFTDSPYKFSYSASIGHQALENSECDEITLLLRTYKAISVREDSAVDLLCRLNITNAVQTLDPTLMLYTADWEKLAAPRLIKENYALIYQLNPNSDFDRFAEKTAAERGLRLVRICNLYDHLFRSGYPVLIPDIPKFLSLFLHGSLIITDSFHGTAFSINFARQFYVFYPPKFSTRLESILKLFSLNDRSVSAKNMTSFNTDGIIEFETVGNQLESERQKTLAFLRNTLDISGGDL